MIPTALPRVSVMGPMIVCGRVREGTVGRGLCWGSPSATDKCPLGSISGRLDQKMMT